LIAERHKGECLVWSQTGEGVADFCSGPVNSAGHAAGNVKHIRDMARAAVSGSARTDAEWFSGLPSCAFPGSRARAMIITFFPAVGMARRSARFGNRGKRRWNGWLPGG